VRKNRGGEKGGERGRGETGERKGVGKGKEVGCKEWKRKGVWDGTK